MTTGIIGCMRVKNEARWIGESVRSATAICDRVIVLDDNSIDDTISILTGIPKATIRLNASSIDQDEARDKNFLVMQARRFDPDWILMIDGDEVLEHPDRVMKAISSGEAPAYTMRIAYLWNDADHVRVDGVYRNMTRPSLFELSATSGIFERTAAAQNFHCGSVPTDLRGRSRPSDAILKHYGYMLQEDRLKKFVWYNEVDPDNEREDRYRHMMIGDRLPAEAVTKHGGPLELINRSEY